MTRNILIDQELEKGYNVRLLRDDFEGLVKAWLARSAEFRQGVDTSLDLAYDSGPKDKLDIFRYGERNAPLFIFIYGGYWQRSDKSIYSFVAESFLKTGADVALIGYQLCPDATMTSMTGQIRKALAWLWRNASEHQISADRINVSGHSASGHLTGMMLSTHWSEVGDDLPVDLIKSGIPISGLYQLEPLRKTTISDALHLDGAETRALSPHLRMPATKVPILVTLGGGETAQFHWQTEEFVREWSKHDIEIAHHVEPTVDHFDVVNRLASTGSEIFGKTRKWLK